MECCPLASTRLAGAGNTSTVNSNNVNNVSTFHQYFYVYIIRNLQLNRKEFILKLVLFESFAITQV